MENARMLGIEEVVAGGTEGGRSPTGVPPTNAANTPRHDLPRHEFTRIYPTPRTGAA